MEKYYACIFESKKTKKRFIGLATESISESLNEINKGKSRDKWILANRPFKTVYSERYNTKEEAEERIQAMKNENRISCPIPKEFFRKG